MKINPIPPGKDLYFSLLWPGGDTASPIKTHHINAQTYKNLELSYIISGIALLPQHQAEIERIIRDLPIDTQVVLYRQEILEDLKQNPHLVTCIKELIPLFDLFTRQRLHKKDENTEIFQLAQRLSELEGYIFCVQKLHKAFDNLQHHISSRGMKELQTYVTDIASDDLFQNLVKELPGLLSDIRGIRSISIGVNLNKDLLPVEATLLSINKDRYKGNKNLIKKLFENSADEHEGIARLHSLPTKEIWASGTKIILNPDTYGYAVNPMLVPLFKDVSILIKKTSKPVLKALKKYVSIKGKRFAGLKNEFIFYLGAINMTGYLEKAGLPMCRPRLLPVEKKICRIKESYNINLALHYLAAKEGKDPGSAVVKNDVAFDPDGRILILTGPNRGGKTTYTQGTGIAQVLAQAGLYVPGTAAEISLVDGIYTHFPIEEKIDKGTGRLGDEARRFSELLSRVTGHSLLLLNESFSSTSAGESFFIARDIVRILRAIGARVIYATHLHELGFAVDEINRSIDGTSKVLSMVACVQNKENEGKKDNKVIRTFKIVPGPPEGQSYALEIASKYGISFPQLKKLFTERGIM